MNPPILEPPSAGPIKAAPAPTALAREVAPRIARTVRREVDKGLHRLEFHAMGTHCRVNAHGAAPDIIRDFQREAVDWVAAFEARYSRFIPDSLIGRINAAAGIDWVETDPETDRLLQFCHEFNFFTRGAFDPTALPLIRLWNWQRRPPVVPAAAEVQAALELTGWRKVQRRPGGIFLPQRGMALDLGGIGKEYAVDCVLSLARRRGIPNALVDFGMDVAVIGHAPNKAFWGIGLDDPKQPGRPWTGVGLTNHAIATSGDYVRYFEVNGVRYGHILDPRTGYPALNDCRAVSVISPTCTMAGLLSTSASVLGPVEGIQLLNQYPGSAGVITTNHDRLFSRQFHEFIHH